MQKASSAASNQSSFRFEFRLRRRRLVRDRHWSSSTSSNSRDIWRTVRRRRRRAAPFFEVSVKRNVIRITEDTRARSEIDRDATGRGNASRRWQRRGQTRRERADHDDAIENDTHFYILLYIEIYERTENDRRLIGAIQQIRIQQQQQQQLRITLFSLLPRG